ncbi:Protein N-acetyltransferase, RimJ/RimL family [Halogranum gelatinilyticum]|uniref:Protein N-acetyltransferase, RimJ/RimL family n=1 Tax=Halogranum gelatinilyticum TaxID=660521 RepID=A0A1G9TMA2_9EURY|nr:GNAT family protein [Halogranum gelatinilyticum]SDM48800.1 Protein N-acetyltransferase, RimJ/RimL family [Halogranum gelatinilyticum]
MSDLFPTYVESERLRYDPLHESIDALDLYDYHRSGELDAVLQPLGETPHATPKETWDELDGVRERWDEGKKASYAITRKEDGGGAEGEFVGVAELWMEWDYSRTSLGTWIRKPFWGRGYAGERAGAMLVVAFECLDLALVDVGHEPGNEQSRRAIEKYVQQYGGQHDASVRNWLPPGDSGGPRDLERYSISQKQWRANVGDDELASVVVER